MESEEYESAEIILDIARTEYQNEFNRTSIIDAKVSITLPIIATYFFLVLQFDSIKGIVLTSPDTESILTMLWSFCRSLIYLGAIICAGIALVNLFHTIVVRAYKTIAPSSFNDKAHMSLPKRIFSAGMVTYYIRATAFNRSTNNHRIAMYKRGWSFALISLFLFVCHVVFTH